MYDVTASEISLAFRSFVLSNRQQRFFFIRFSIRGYVDVRIQ